MSKFQIDVDKALGHKFQPQRVSYNKRDLIIYALSIGIKEDELKYIYELDRNFTPFPTYPVVLQLKGDSPDVNLFSKSESFSGRIPGLPAFDPNKVVHGEEKLEVINPIPTSGEFEIHSEVSKLYDKGSGILMERVNTMVDPKTNTVYCVFTEQVFIIGYGGFGGPRGPKGPNYTPPEGKKPDAIGVCKTDVNQALLYRLSGDYNPLHVDQEIAQKLGFEKPVLHGLCSFGIATNAIIKNLANNDPELLKSISVRFTAPVYPGDTLETFMWKVPGENLNETNVIFVTKTKESDAVVLGNGFAVLKNSH